VNRHASSLEHQISAARWPLLLATSVLLFALTVAAPLVVFTILERTVRGSTATLAALATGIAMVIAIAVAWVLIRSRREAEGL
jgi:hypothetical protein